MLLIAENMSREHHEPVASADDLIEWRQRYDGVLVVAYLDGKAVAGISGPWPVSQYALTWWDRPVPARQLELFDSMEAAQRRVEEWAWRMRTVGLIGRSPANDPIEPENETATVAPLSWLARIGGWFTPKASRPRCTTFPSSARHQVLRPCAQADAPEGKVVGLTWRRWERPLGS